MNGRSVASGAAPRLGRSVWPGSLMSRPLSVIKHTEPSVCEANALVMPNTIVVGASMNERVVATESNGSAPACETAKPVARIRITVFCARWCCVISKNVATEDKPSSIALPAKATSPCGSGTPRVAKSTKQNSDHKKVREHQQ